MEEGESHMVSEKPDLAVVLIDTGMITVVLAVDWNAWPNRPSVEDGGLPVRSQGGLPLTRSRGTLWLKVHW